MFIDIPSIIAERKVLSKLDYLIATEKNVAFRFQEKNPKTEIIYNYSYFQPIEIDKNAEKEFDLIYCGSIADSKGLFLMLDAIIQSKKKGFDLKFILVGGFHDIKQENRAKQIILQENLENNVFFTGEIFIDEIGDYYKKSKAAFCLFPFNRTNQLILPIKLFEYAAFGLPIIGSNFGHVKEIIEENNIGIFVNPHNSDAVSSAIIQLIEEDKYKEYIPRCVNCVREKYSWENEKSKLLDIYNKLAK